MPVTKKASEFVSKLSRKYVNSRKDEEALALAAKKVEMAKENVPLEPSKETLDYDKNNPKPMVK
jgi:hypothetical protein